MISEAGDVIRIVADSRHRGRIAGAEPVLGDVHGVMRDEQGEQHEDGKPGEPSVPGESRPSCGRSRGHDTRASPSSRRDTGGTEISRRQRVSVTLVQPGRGVRDRSRGGGRPTPRGAGPGRIVASGRQPGRGGPAERQRDRPARRRPPPRRAASRPTARRPPPGPPGSPRRRRRPTGPGGRIARTGTPGPLRTTGPWLKSADE